MKTILVWVAIQVWSWNGTYSHTSKTRFDTEARCELHNEVTRTTVADLNERVRMNTGYEGRVSVESECVKLHANVKVMP